MVSEGEPSYHVDGGQDWKLELFNWFIFFFKFIYFDTIFLLNLMFQKMLKLH